ncbi:MAG: ABC transporter permease [Candidatus Marinimicrobia bacterium]|nr:ABC transporter permease [Candidatus Neomarinimicrobiota bacterium]
MMETFLYLIAEGFKNLWREKLSVFASIFAIAIAMSFVVFGGITGQDFSRIIKVARSQYELQVFFSPMISDSEASRHVDEIIKIRGVKSANLVTKQEAAEIFEREFGENLFDLLRENPLPSSCVVKFDENVKKKFDVHPIVNQIKMIKDVEEVRYQGRLITIIERYYQGFFTIVTGIFVIILLGTMILIFNTIRLTIYSRRDLIRALKLVGATNRFVRFPFMVEGMIEGFIAAMLAGSFAYGFIRVSNYFLAVFTRYKIHWDWQVMWQFVGLMVLFSLIASRQAVRKFLK